MTQRRIPAVYMRGGTSKGVFFLAADLPGDAVERDRVLLRVIGSPDRYGQHIDGMGGATSSTSKVVIIAKSARPGFDVDYLFGAVAVTEPVIDWSGNCGNLSAAVGPFAISSGLVRAPRDGTATVRIWQANIRKPIVAHVPMRDGEVQEEGDFELDGVAFPAAEVRLEFVDPAAEDGASAGRGMFPSGAKIDRIDVPGLGAVEATLIDAGNPTIFIDARTLRLRGTELQPEVNGRRDLLAAAEAIRAHAAVAMGLVETGRAGHRDATAHAQAGVRRRTAGLRRLGWQADRGKLDRSRGAHLLDGQAASRDDWNRCRRPCRGGCDPRHGGAPYRARGQRWPRAVRPCLRHAASRCRGAPRRRAMDGRARAPEPLGTPPDGRMGAGSGGLRRKPRFDAYAQGFGRRVR